MSTSHPVRALHTCTLARVNLGAEEFTKHVSSLCFILFVGRVQVIPATPSLRWWSPQLLFSGWHGSFPLQAGRRPSLPSRSSRSLRSVTSVARSDESRLGRRVTSKSQQSRPRYSPASYRITRVARPRFHRAGFVKSREEAVLGVLGV